MGKPPLLLSELADFLQVELTTDRYPVREQGGIYRPSARPIRRIGLALEPSPGLADWVCTQHLDALWLHRPWRLDMGTLPPGVGVLYHHLPFDEHLTTGYNTRLADALSMVLLEELGHKQALDDSGTYPANKLFPKRAIGMIGNSPERTYDDWLALIQREFGGYDQVEPRSPAQEQVRTYKRVAVVGAMNPTLVQEAHERGVTLYLTGEYRKGTQATVEETEMTVIAIGHRRTEEWGLRALGTLLLEQWAGLEVMLE